MCILFLAIYFFAVGGSLNLKLCQRARSWAREVLCMNYIPTACPEDQMSQDRFSAMPDALFSLLAMATFTDFADPVRSQAQWKGTEEICSTASKLLSLPLLRAKASAHS